MLPAGLSQLPNARKFNLGKYPKGTLRQRFPAAGLGFDGRPPLSEQGFHLLSSLLEMCPVSGGCGHRRRWLALVRHGFVLLWRHYTTTPASTRALAKRP